MAEHPKPEKVFTSKVSIIVVLLVRRDKDLISGKKPNTFSKQTTQIWTVQSILLRTLCLHRNVMISFLYDRD